MIGICGGYQMLGERILDPQRIESRETEVRGLGLLPVTTTFSPVKSTHQVKGRVVYERGEGILQNAAGLPVAGYEIHMGQSASDSASAPFSVEERSRTPSEGLDGCVSADGDVLGTYIHGLFHSEGLRRSILSELAARKGLPLQLGGEVVSKEEQYDRLAALVRGNLDMDLVYRVTGLGDGSASGGGGRNPFTE